MIFGCALVGMHGFTDAATFASVMDILRQGGVDQLDTAARYPPSKQGESERLIGEAHAGDQEFSIDTKVLMGFNDGSDELSSPSIAKSIRESREHRCP
jgi:aflatoxin B1 aldehyde reductase